MPNDARLGLVVGVGLVLAVAVVFFRKDLITRKPVTEPAASTIRPAKALPPARSVSQPARARTVSRAGGDTEQPSGQAGDRQERPADDVDSQPRPEGNRQPEQH